MPLDRLVPELYSSHLDRSLSFYVGDLGFHILYHRPEEKFVFLERETAHIMIEQIGASRTWIAGEIEYPYGRGVSFQIPTVDVTGLYNSLQQKGYSFFLPLEEKWYAREDMLVGNHQFIIQDPDGFLLRFAEDLGTKPKH
jgi:catechol 2,3-dioxygenase-like lactoylglutathione lyase family enzyme